MASKTDSTPEAPAGMTIAQIVAAFSDYDSRIVRIGVHALEQTVAHYEDNLWPAIDALCEDGEEWDSKDVTVKVLHDRAVKAVKAARKAGADIEWSMSAEKLGDVLRVRKLHTAGRLAVFEGFAVRESTRKASRNVKAATRTYATTMSSYAGFLREIGNGYRDEDGELTSDGIAAAKTAADKAEKLAKATFTLDGVDWDRDTATMSAEQKLATFLRWEQNLKVRIAELKAELGDDASKVTSAFSDAKKKAAGLK